MPADKTQTIKNSSDKNIDELLIRLRKEAEVQRLIADLKRKSMPKDPHGDYTSYEQPEVSTEKPIESLYHGADKSQTIKNSSDKNIDELLIRLRKETEVQRLIAELKRKSMPKDPLGNYVSYEQPEVSTEQPIESLYHKVDEVLAHFGVRGMRWGVRNKTGPNGLVIRRPSPRKSSEDHAKSRRLKAKKTHELSDQELQALTKRLMLERQYRELKVSDYTKGMEVAKGVLSVGTTLAAIYALSTTPAAQAVKNALKG